MLVDITDRKRAEAELVATKDHLAMEVAALKRLHELSAYLARSAEAGECLHAILHTIVELHQADCGIIALHDPRAESLNIGASTGIQHDVLAKLPLTPHAESGAIGSAFATRQRVVIEDVTTDARYTGSQSLAALAGVRAVHSTPILTRSGELLGVLTVYFRQPRLPTEREKQYADICALHAGDAIEAARAEQALRESEQRFRTMADTAPAMLWVTDANARCTFQSRAWYEYTGMDLGGASNFGWLDAVHPEDRDATRQEFLRANTQRASFSLDYRLRHADGAYRWVIDTGQPRFDADGAFLGYIGSVMDIHDRKQADQHLRMVLAELNHRVKNTLASIDAMAHQTARHSDSLEQFQQSFSQRIRSLGHAHGLLTRTRWEGASLRELLKTELKPRCGHDEQVHLNGPAIILRPKAALALHMVIHELATNAAKYGALSAAQGHVEVEWYVAQQSDEAQLHLRWTELGGPPVAPPVRRGFGSRVLDATVAYELEGELKLEFRKTGLICVINFPLTDNSGFLSTHDEEREKQVHLPIE
jgi:PAS domain S-box-containing protein